MYEEQESGGAGGARPVCLSVHVCSSQHVSSSDFISSSDLVRIFKHVNCCIGDCVNRLV